VIGATIVRLLMHPWLKNTPIHLRSGVYPVGRFVNELLDAVIYAGVFVFFVIRPFFVQTFYIPSGSMQTTLHENDFVVVNKLIYRYTEPKRGDIIVFKPPTRALAPGQAMTDFIKRLVGVPGDTIELRDRVLYRDGQPVQEPYRHYTTMTSRVPPRYRELSPEELANDPPQNFKLVSIEGELIPVQYMGTMANVQRMFGIGVADEYTLESLAARFNTTEEEMNRRLLEAKPVPVPDGMYLMMGDNRHGSFDSRGWGLVKRSDIVGRSDAIWLPVGRWRLTH
jgi:signal peptidase I